MNGYWISLDEYIYVLTGLTALLGFIIYVVFYDLFQRLGGRRVRGELDDVAVSPVMSGLYVSEPSFPSVRKTVVDILYRSWRGVSTFIERSVWSIFRDWYVVAYTVLVLITIISLIMGW